MIVKFSEDKKWYRGVIKHFKVPDKGIARRSITDDEFVYNVLHVDFGSSEWVGPSEIRPVVETFFELPIETLPCCLAGISPMGKLDQMEMQLLYYCFFFTCVLFVRVRLSHGLYLWFLFQLDSM